MKELTEMPSRLANSSNLPTRFTARGYFMKRTKRQVSLQTSENTTYSGAQELNDSENGLVGYSTEIVKKLIKYSGISIGSGESVLEFGAGNGFLADIWKREHGRAPECVEIDSSLVAIIRGRGIVCFSSLKECPNKYDVIYTSNVLEHIQDDVQALISLRNHLNSNGKIAIYVPAFPMLFSDMDRNVGHFRRYQKKELIQKVTLAGFRVDTCIFDDFIGFFASLVVKVFGYKSSTNLGSLRTLKFYDTRIYPMSKFLDKLFTRKLLGKNILLVAEAITVTKPSNNNLTAE